MSDDLGRTPIPVLFSRDARVGETAIIAGWGNDQNQVASTLRAGSTTITAVGSTQLQTQVQRHSELGLLRRLGWPAAPSGRRRVGGGRDHVRRDDNGMQLRHELLRQRAQPEHHVVHPRPACPTPRADRSRPRPRPSAPSSPRNTRTCRERPRRAAWRPSRYRGLTPAWNTNGASGVRRADAGRSRPPRCRRRRGSGCSARDPPASSRDAR